MTTRWLGAMLLWPTLLTAAPPAALNYQVAERLPMPTGLFVQGVEFHNGDLYVSTGKYGESQLLQLSFPTLQTIRGRQLNEAIFAEGLTVSGDYLLQLTWRARGGLRYHLDTLELADTFILPGEGWGICADDERLVYSDGSATLRFLSPGSQQITGSIEVTLDGVPLPRLNELECHEDAIWANVWTADQLVRINPSTGEVNAVLDLAALYPKALRPAGVDVLNGIAFDQQNRLWVTGKYWPWLYRLDILPASHQGVSPP